MKKSILFFLAIFFIASSSFATVHIISVSDLSFSPTNVPNVRFGDTVRFEWVSGMHTTTSAGIPAGAANWDSPITSTNTSYTYVPTVGGAYNYICTPHPSMYGSFIVGMTNGIGSLATSDGFNISPNPATGVLHLRFTHSGEPVSITIISLIGREVLSKSYTNEKDADINIQSIPDGIYIIRAQQGGRSYIRKVTIDN